MTPLPGSPLIDAGDNATCTETDQLGVMRPQDVSGDGEVRCDIGAVELDRALKKFKPAVSVPANNWQALGLLVVFIVLLVGLRTNRHSFKV